MDRALATGPGHSRFSPTTRPTSMFVGVCLFFFPLPLPLQEHRSAFAGLPFAGVPGASKQHDGAADASQADG